MSTTVDVAFTKQYEREVHEAYQRMGSKLRPWVRTRSVVNAKDVTFQIVGKGSAGTKGRHSLVPTMNQTHTNVTATMQDYYAADWCDKLDELKTNIDERQVIANGAAAVLGRTTDQLIINALDGAATNTQTMSTASAAAFHATVLTAIKKLNARDVPDDGQRYAAVSPTFWSWLMLVKEFVSADWVGSDSLPFKQPSTQMKSWAGFVWMVHPGLTGVDTSTAVSHLFHRSAVGLGTNQDISTDITWHGDRAAHFISCMMSMGAVLIDGEGTVKMTLDETAALAQ